MIDYIYALCCPYTGYPKYIGKSNKPKIRYWQHIIEKSQPKTISLKKFWIDSLRNEGKKPVLLILCKCSPERTEYYEKLCFDILSSDYKLLNTYKFPIDFKRTLPDGTIKEFIDLDKYPI